VPEGSRPDTFRLAKQVLDLLEPELAADSYDLLDVRVFQGGGRLQVRIFVDTAAGGINIDQCAKAARTAGMLLEEADIFAGQYVIEVSSPGIRRPLRKPEHFVAAVGQKVDLKVRKSSGSGRVRGVLREATEAGLVVGTMPVGESTDEPENPDAQETLDTENVPDEVLVSIESGDVLEANLDPEFDVQALINADRRERKNARRAERQAKRGKKRGRPKDRSGKGKTSGDDNPAGDD